MAYEIDSPVSEGNLQNVPLTPPLPPLERSQPSQEGYQWGRCFKHLKKSALSFSLSILALTSCPVGMYAITDQLIQYKDGDIRVMFAGVFVDLVLLVFTTAGAVTIAKNCCKAIKKGCSNQNNLLLQAEIM